MTTNTHIAAQARSFAESHDSIAEVLLAGSPTFVSRNRGNLAKNTADLLRQCAQALEAAPALDAQGEAVAWQYRWTNPGENKLVAADELEWKPLAPRWNEPMSERVAEMESYRHNGKPCYEVRALAVRASAPLPHAVGKPLSDELADAIQRASNVRRHLLDYVRSPTDQTAIELIKAVAHGIVTKESST